MQTEMIPAPAPRTLIPLVMVGDGETVTLRTIHGGSGVNKRLAEMGLIPDEKITVIKNHRPGGLILQVKDSRLCIGHGIAHKIQVEIE